MNWVLGKIAFFRQNKKTFLSKSGKGKADYLKHKKQATELIANRVNFFNETYKVSFNRVSVKNQKTRWGSCSTKGNLNFNYKILFLPEKTRDYIVVHEICHLKEFNHSKKFWALVEKTFPDYRETRKELRRFML